MKENDIGDIVVDHAIRLHKGLGPGLWELVYEVILAHKLQREGLTAERQVPIPIQYEGIHFDEGFKADVIIDDKVLLELKSIEKVTKRHLKQTHTYAKLTGEKLAYLLNFGEAVMKDGIYRIINGNIDD